MQTTEVFFMLVPLPVLVPDFDNPNEKRKREKGKGRERKNEVGQGQGHVHEEKGNEEFTELRFFSWERGKVRGRRTRQAG